MIYDMKSEQKEQNKKNNVHNTFFQGVNHRGEAR